MSHLPTTTDDFTAAAHAEAETRIMGNSGFAREIRKQLVNMAEWARDYLDAKKPKPRGGEVIVNREALLESIAKKLCDPSRHVVHWPLAGTSAYCGQCYDLAGKVIPLVEEEVREGKAEVWSEATRFTLDYAYLNPEDGLTLILPHPRNINPYHEQASE